MSTFLSQGKFVYYILIIYLVNTYGGTTHKLEGRLYKSQFAQVGTRAGHLVDSAFEDIIQTMHHFKLNEEALLSGEVHFSQIDKYCCNKDKHQSSTVARFWTRITTCHCYFQVLLSWCKLYEPFLEVLPSSTVLPWAVMLCIDNVSAINKKLTAVLFIRNCPSKWWLGEKAGVKVHKIHFIQRGNSPTNALLND